MIDSLIDSLYILKDYYSMTGERELEHNTRNIINDIEYMKRNGIDFTTVTEA